MTLNDHNLNEVESPYVIEQTWTGTALQVYFDTRLEALKELKTHDLKSIHDRIDTLERRLKELFDIKQDYLAEFDRRLQERMELATTFMRERAEYHRLTLHETMTQNRTERIAGDHALSESIKSAMLTIDERFRATREFNDQSSRASTEALRIALAASKEAVDKAERSVEKRFDSINEFRQTLGDVQNRMIQRVEVDAANKAIHEKIDSITSRMDRMQGADHGTSTQTSTLISVAAVVIALIVGVITFITFIRTPHPGTPTPEAVRNFYLSQPPPTGQLVPGPPRQ